VFDEISVEDAIESLVVLLRPVCWLFAAIIEEQCCFSRSVNCEGMKN